MTSDPAQPNDTAPGTPEADASRQGRHAATEAEMRANVIRLAFGGDESRLNEFCKAILEVLPTTTSAVLRGSAITGVRWKDGAPFDAARIRPTRVNVAVPIIEGATRPS